MVAKNAMNKLHCEVPHRSDKAKTIPGKRSMHYFEPACSLSIRGRERMSSDTKFSS